MKCYNCEKKISLFGGHAVRKRMVCNNCYKNHYDEVKTKISKQESEFASESKIDESELNKIILTTETYSKDFEIKERLGIISSETVLGMNMFRDIFANVRDIVGGKSVSTKKVLKDLKSNAFLELKKQAYNLDADAVIAIDLDYSEFSGGGKSMLFLVATGTAVIFKENAKTKIPRKPNNRVNADRPSL